MRRPLMAVLVGLLVSMAGAPAGAASLFGEAMARLRFFGLVGSGEIAMAEPITRAELARLAVVASGRADRAQALAHQVPFPDLAGHPEAGFVAAAREAGLVAGFPDGTFDPGGLVTYGEAMTVLARVIGLPPASGLPWPANYIAAVAGAGAVPDGLPVLEYAGLPAVRGAVLILLDGALYRARDEGGRNGYQRGFDPVPPRVLISPWLMPAGGTVRVVGRATGAARVEVAGRAAALDGDDSFSVPVPLQPGPNRILVVAEDLAGNRTTVEVVVSGPARP